VYTSLISPVSAICPVHLIRALIARIFGETHH
jgi:hypothetical protein